MSEGRLDSRPDVVPDGGGGIEVRQSLGAKSEVGVGPSVVEFLPVSLRAPQPVPVVVTVPTLLSVVLEGRTPPLGKTDTVETRP